MFSHPRKDVLLQAFIKVGEGQVLIAGSARTVVETSPDTSREIEICFFPAVTLAASVFLRTVSSTSNGRRTGTYALASIRENSLSEI
jgi:hypothetical protein